MGNQNSKSSFKQNNSITNSINFINSQQFSFNQGNSQKSMNKEADVLTKFSWNYGGHNVLLTGSFNRWKQTIPLQRQGQQFSITILLPRGLHFYKFIVDGQWRFSPEDPSMPDNNGNINNYIDTTNYLPLIEKKQSSGQHYPIIKQDKLKNVQEFNKQAPKLSPHYYTCGYLGTLQPKINGNEMNEIEKNQQKMQVQEQNHESFEKSLSANQVKYLFNSYHCLSPPNHVALDHLIAQSDTLGNNYSSLAITQRFKSKYTTYKYFTVAK